MKPPPVRCQLRSPLQICLHPRRSPEHPITLEQLEAQRLIQSGHLPNMSARAEAALSLRHGGHLEDIGERLKAVRVYVVFPCLGSRTGPPHQHQITGTRPHRGRPVPRQPVTPGRSVEITLVLRQCSLAPHSPPSPYVCSKFDHSPEFLALRQIMIPTNDEPLAWLQFSDRTHMVLEAMRSELELDPSVSGAAPVPVRRPAIGELRLDDVYLREPKRPMKLSEKEDHAHLVLGRMPDALESNQLRAFTVAIHRDVRGKLASLIPSPLGSLATGRQGLARPP